MTHRLLRALRRPLRQLTALAVDAVLPPVCPGCGVAAERMCRVCDQNLVRRPLPGCRRCGEPVLVAGAACGADHRDLRHIALHVAPWRYCGTGGELVRRFKLAGDAGAGRAMARAMAAAWRAAAGPEWARAVLVPGASPIRIGPATRARIYAMSDGEWELSANCVEIPEGWYCVPPSFVEAN